MLEGTGHGGVTNLTGGGQGRLLPRHGFWVECLNVIDNKQKGEGMVSQALTTRNEVMFGLKCEGSESISRVHTRRRS